MWQSKGCGNWKKEKTDLGCENNHESKETSMGKKKGKLNADNYKRATHWMKKN
jgi:hypothetical protein